VRKRLQDEKPAVVNNQYVYAEDLGSLSPSLSYRRLRLFAHEKGKPLTHTWEGSAHETLVCRRILDRPSVDWDDWVLVHYRNDNIDFKSKTGRNIKMLEKELKEFPDNPRTMFYLGREYKDYGDFDKSIVMLTKYLHKSNFTLEKYQALLDLGYMYLGKEDYDSAEEKARQAIDLIPEVSFAYNLLGEIKMSLNRPDLARMYFAQSVYAPHGPVLFDYIPSRTYLPHRHLSVACYYSGMYKEALNHHMIARKLAPHDLSLRYNDPWLIDNTEDFPQELSDLNGCNELFLKSESVSQFTSDLLPEDTFEVSDEEAISRIDSINDCRCFYITIPDLNDEMLDLIVSKLNNEKPAAIIVNKFGNWRVKFTVAKFLSRHSEVSLIRSYDSLRGNQNFIADDGIGIIIVRK
jgi:tetratricopeptide (TPR) repeat protein